MQGFAIASRPSIEVLSAYSAPTVEIEAVAATPGWHVVGSFYLPISTPILLELFGLVSAAGLTLRARLFDLADNEPVAGSECSTTSTIDSRTLGPAVDLTGGHSYQLQAECTGATGLDKFGVVHSLAPTV